MKLNLPTDIENNKSNANIALLGHINAPTPAPSKASVMSSSAPAKAILLLIMMFLALLAML